MAIVTFNNKSTWDVDRLLKDFFSESAVKGFPATFRNDLPVNIYEEPEQFLIELSAPGREKARFNLKLEAESLVISYDSDKEQQEHQPKVLRREFRNNGFKLNFHVDDQVDADQINASYDQGILRVILPKKKPARPVGKTIAIQ
jgi:HSP20 family protein